MSPTRKTNFPGDSVQSTMVTFWPAHCPARAFDTAPTSPPGASCCRNQQQPEAHEHVQVNVDVLTQTMRGRSGGGGGDGGGAGEAGGGRVRTEAQGRDRFHGSRGAY